MNKNINEIPSIFTVLGVTGDLAAKKIIPSLWNLFKNRLLPKRLLIIGFSRQDLSTEDFQNLILKALDEHTDVKVDKENFLDFLKFFNLFYYQKGNFDDENTFKELSDVITKTEDKWGLCSNKLFYLAVPPKSFEPIFRNLANVKLNLPCGGELGWTRILVEKPFGLNLKEAHELQDLLSKYFKEEQIYRIDHYLFKEIIQGIENFRFSNNLFEKTWDNTMIESIQIRLMESIGVEGRGGFYDPVGAFRDVGQNHLLAMLNAITMQYPSGIGADAVRENRADILKSLAPWTEETLQKNTFRAQYKDYKKIEGVKPDSTTETYFAMKTELLHPDWEGIPIYMEAGKCMSEARKEIIITLKQPALCLMCEAGAHAPNSITFGIEPKDEINIRFWAKKPGYVSAIEERNFSFFLYEKQEKNQYVEEYAKIIYTSMAGDQTPFLSVGEVMASWEFADPVTDSWTRNEVPLIEYDMDTTPKPDLLKHDENIKVENSKSGEIGIIGLGKMGFNLARQLHMKNWDTVVYDRKEVVVAGLEAEGHRGARTLEELAQKLSKPRLVWIMVPYQIVDEVISGLVPFLEKGDTVIDGGNSPFKESVRRNKELAEKGINFLDVGVSGGPGGALNGACIMVGGDIELYKKYEKLFGDLSVKNGFGYMGEAGAGHFVKMVHNGIEYGMMQSMAEGFNLLKNGPYHLDLKLVAKIYNHGSVVSSSLMKWLHGAFVEFGDELDNDENCSPSPEQSGEGQWTVDIAKELNQPVQVIEDSLEFRKKSKDNPSYIGRVISALRNQFGGHKKINK